MGQYKAILYKEWVKTRWVLLIAVGIGLSLLIYTLFNIYRITSTFGMAKVYGAMINEGLIFLSHLRYIPLLIGLALGLAQMIPEAQQHRLKLSIHVPLRDGQVCYSLLSFGAIILLAYNALVVLTAGSLLLYYLPHELVGRCLVSYLPWGLAGFAAYFLSAWVCLEHQYYPRTIASLIALGLLDLFFYSNGPESLSSGMLILLVGIVAISALLPRYAIDRFRTGYTY